MEPKGTKRRLSERFSGFTLDQWRFITARLTATTDKEAAISLGMNEKTPSKWSNKPEINDALKELRIETTEGAIVALKQSSLKAAMVVVNLTDSGDEAVRLRAAQDILDRSNGKPTQRQELTGKDGDQLIPFTQIVEALQKANDRKRSAG